MTELFGRDDDLEQLRAAAAASRLVTVVGPVGVGKTRLARELLRGGSCVEVDLSERADLLGLRAELAGALDVSADALEPALAEAPPVVLDNFEQLVEPAAGQLVRWLREVPSLRLLVTSRQRLGLSEETVFELSPLSASAAEALFVSRARQVDRGYEPGAAERTAIEALCAELDGLPLAIELAAARLRVMSAAELLERLGDRFEALGEGPRDAHERHASLEHALASAWAALDEPGRSGLAQCAVFEGGFDLEAAEAVVRVEGAGAISTLESLVDRSLLARDRSEAGTRYRLLASVRAYARAHGEPEAAEERHRGVLPRAGLRDGRPLRTAARHRRARLAAARGREPARDLPPRARGR